MNNQSQQQPAVETTWGEFKKFFSKQHDDSAVIRAKVFPVTNVISPATEMEVFTFSRAREREGTESLDEETKPL